MFNLLARSQWMGNIRSMVTVLISFRLPEIINLKRGKVCFGLHFGGFSSWSFCSVVLEPEVEQRVKAGAWKGTKSLNWHSQEAQRLEYHLPPQSHHLNCLTYTRLHHLKLSASKYYQEGEY